MNLPEYIKKPGSDTIEIVETLSYEDTMAALRQDFPDVSDDAFTKAIRAVIRDVRETVEDKIWDHVDRNN